MIGGPVVHLCAACLAGRAESVVAELEDVLDAQGIAVRAEVGPCLGPCGSPVALALQGGGAAYVFAGVRLPEDMADLAATCRAYLDSPGGWIADARPCGRLRLCLRTRVPGVGGA